MTADFRALCEELLDALNGWHSAVFETEVSWVRPDETYLIDRARAALAEPQPPDDGEVANPWKRAVIDALVCNWQLKKEHESDPVKALNDLISWEVELARDPLINPSPQPPANGEVGELVGWLLCISKHFRHDGLGDEADRTHRAADLLERLVSPACLVLKPSPELIKTFQEGIKDPGVVVPMQQGEHLALPSGEGLKSDPSKWRRLLWDVEEVSGCEPEPPFFRLAQRRHSSNPPPQPIPVSERLPEAGDCDAEGMCWVHQPHDACPESPAWELMPAKYASSNYGSTCWLPAHALPLPSGEVEE
jgi:hypothetical protein